MAVTDLHGVAFPKLTDRELGLLERCMGVTRRAYPDGATLIRSGERSSLFFVITAGTAAVVDDSGDTPRTIAILERGDFTGDAAQLMGAASLVTIVARGACEAFEISHEGLRHVLNRSPDLGDTILQAFVARRALLREPGNFTGLRVIGSRYSRDTFRIREFLAKNRVPFTTLDLESEPQVRQLLEAFGVREDETPVVAWGRGLILRNPSERQLAEALGLRRPPEHKMHDLVIIGAGPAGLAAAVYGASEGLDTVVLERAAPGGQAGSSMRIENYLGFPTGITGAELADRAALQAAKFGAALPVATTVAGLTFDGSYAIVHLDGGETVSAKCLLLATGADYRRLEAEGRERFEGRGIYYAATPVESPVCRGATAVVVGAGNSAGQATVFLSTQARRVVLVVRGDSLYKNMSSYLVERVQQTENVEVLYRTVVRRVSGNDWLREVETQNLETGATQVIVTPALFSFIGAVPRVQWLPNEIEKDEKGFVLTGASVAPVARGESSRDRYLLETSRTGVFAAGDVRSGSVKRVASAVGEGAMAVQLVHEYLKHK